MSLLPQIQQISQLQGRIHILENIYNTELHAFQTTHRVTTLCTDTDVLCFITQILYSRTHRYILWGLLGGLLLCFCLCFCCFCCPRLIPIFYKPSPRVTLVPLREIDVDLCPPDSLLNLNIPPIAESNFLENLQEIEVINLDIQDLMHIQV